MNSKLKGKNVLVTGGTGFVGSHLVEELVEIGAHVHTTYLTQNPLSYFSQLKLHNKVKMFNADICDFEKMHDIITKSEIQYIFHVAAQPIVETAFYNPRRTLYSNIVGTINILESARLYPKVKGIIVASSDKAYGKTTEKKYFEHHALKGDHPYEVSKSAADLICQTYYKTYGLPIVVTRFGNIYGEGDLNYSRIIPGAVYSLIKDQILELRSDGTFVRDYLYVKDVVNGYILLMEEIDRVKGEVFNFGSSDTLTVLDVIKIMNKKLKTEVKYKIMNTAKNEIPYQSLNYDKITQHVGWKPNFSLERTIKNIHKWYSVIL